MRKLARTLTALALILAASPALWSQQATVSAAQLRSLDLESLSSDGIYSPFGTYFAVITRSNRVRVYNSDYDELWNYRGQGQHGTGPAVVFTSDEEFVIFPGHGNPSRIAMVRADSGELVTTLDGHTDEVKALAVSPDNLWLVSVQYGGTAIVWRRDGLGFSLHHRLEREPVPVLSLAFAPSSDLFAVGNNQDYVELFSLDGASGSAEPRFRASGELRPNQYYGNASYLFGLAFSPNGRWLVFSSKVNSAYTQLFLTHIDEEGRSTPPVVLSHFTDPQRAANIPEFVNASPTAIAKIREQFLDDFSYIRAGREFYKADDFDNAMEEYCNALQINPDSFEAHLRLTILYSAKEMYEQARTHHSRAKALCAVDPFAAYRAGIALMQEERYTESVLCFSIVLRESPSGVFDKDTVIRICHNFGIALRYENRFEESAARLSEAVRLDPKHAGHHYELALTLACQGKTGNLDGAIEHFAKAVSLEPGVDRSPRLHRVFAMRYAQAGRFREAVSAAEHASELAHARGEQDLVRQIEEELEFYRRNQVPRRP